MTTDPDQIRRDIEGTRQNLSADVDTLNEKVNPRYVVQRGRSRVRDRFVSARESVMGTAHAGRSQAGGAMSGAQDTASSAASSVSDTASSAADTVIRRTEGNPLAAGLIAFGVGWLASSLLPSTDVEQRAGTQLKERGSDLADTVKEEAKSVAQDMGESMRQPAQEAAESVRSTAQDAASNISDDAQSARQDATEQARESQQNVQRQTGS